MLMLADHNFKIVKTCQNNQEFCDSICYLKNQENQKSLLEPGPKEAKREFLRCHHRFLKVFFEAADQEGFRKIAQQSYTTQQDMLIIYKGAREIPLFAPVPPGFCLDQFRKDWAEFYAKNHGFHVITG